MTGENARHGERGARFNVRRTLRLAEPYSLLGLAGRSARQQCPATTHKKARKDLHDGRSGRLSWLRIGFGPSAVGTEAGGGFLLRCFLISLTNSSVWPVSKVALAAS